MTTPPEPLGSVRAVDGGWWDRAQTGRSPDLDAVLALGGARVGFALLEPSPDELAAALGYALGTTDSVAAAGDWQPGYRGLAYRYAFWPM